MGKEKKNEYLRDMLYKPIGGKDDAVGLPYYWQNADRNRREVIVYRNWILSIMMQRYKWEGLPDTCDERYLEWILCTQGVATICNVDPLGWISTQAATTGTPNIYDNPIHWESIGNNGHNAPVDPTNGVLVWSNYRRLPEWNFIDLWSRRLAQCDSALEANLVQQKVPWIITGPYEKQQDMIQLVKQAAGGEPAVLGLKGIENVDIELLMTPVEFKGEALQNAKQRIWNDIYTFCGISNLERKGERMIEEEVLATNEPVMRSLLDGLSTRRDAANLLNERFGLDIHVYSKFDNESKNYNIEHNLEDISNILDLSTTLSLGDEEPEEENDGPYNGDE